ncbi:MAG: hypothetical protein JXQ97_00540 [Natronospirillum sp.]
MRWIARRSDWSALLMGLSVAIAVGSPAVANDFFGDLNTTAAAPAATQSPWRLLGWAQHKTAYGYRDPEPGFSRAAADITRFESSLYGQGSVRFGDWSARLAGSLEHDWLPDAENAGLWSGYAFTGEQAEARQWQWLWADSYLSWQSGDWWLQGGYQTLAWGQAESIAVLDVLAPRDQRWPGQVDLEQMRLPVPALTLNWRGQLDLVVLDGTQSDRLAAPFDEFDTLAELRATGSEIVEQTPANHLGYALRWQQRWSGVDVQVMAAQLNSYTPSLRAVTMGGMGPERIELRQEPVQVLGGGVQWVRGAWLWRTEQAWHRGGQLPTSQALEPWVDVDEWRSMMGVEYSGWSNLTLSAEVGALYLLRNADTVDADEWRWSQSVRTRWTGWNDRLALTLQAVGLPGDEGWLTRAEAEWKPNDPLSLSLSVVEYHAWRDEQALYAVRHNDAITLNLRFGF